MRLLIEDIEGSLWAVAIDKKNKIQAIEIDPFTEIIRWGSVYVGKVGRIDAGQNLAYIDLGYGFEGQLHAKDVRLEDGSLPEKSKKIGQILRPGQMVLVQVKTPHNPSGRMNKEAKTEKISKLSMDITIQGRYLIHAPFMPDNRLSKRITDKDLRKSLKSMLGQLEGVQGCILRAAAAHCQTDILIREYKILRAIWASLQELKDESEPTLLMLGPSALQRMLADLANQKVDSITVATMEIFEEAEEWCDLYAPDLMTKIIPGGADNTRSGMGLFEINDLIGQFEGFLKSSVALPSGGSILIEDTAAMTVIDVNQGSDKNKFNTNLEAAGEIARQLRIRNLNGIIMADFISMASKAQQNKVMAAIETALSQDPCTTECHGMTALGVFEISRQRRTPTFIEKMQMFEMDDERED